MAAPTVDEEQQETNEEKCQIKAGAAFAHVKKAWNLLKDRHKQDIRTAGFGSIENCKITGSICRPLAAHIYDNLDTESMTITFGDGTEDKKNQDYQGSYTQGVWIPKRHGKVSTKAREEPNFNERTDVRPWLQTYKFQAKRTVQGAKNIGGTR